MRVTALSLVREAVKREELFTFFAAHLAHKSKMEEESAPPPGQNCPDGDSLEACNEDLPLAKLQRKQVEDPVNVRSPSARA